MLKRSGPVALVIAGALLLLGSGGYLLYARALADPGAAAVPESIAGAPLSQKTVGIEAVAEVARLHGKEFPLMSGAMAMCGEGAAALWVSGTAASPLAAGMVRAMTDKIAQGRSPFTPTGTRRLNGRAVYELDGLGQRHFYFQSGSLVIWLTADDSIAENALGEVLQFYP